MVRAMYNNEMEYQERDDREFNYYDINSVMLSGRVVNNPKLITRGYKQTLEFRFAYRKGDKSAYVDVIVFNNVENAAKLFKRGSYAILQGFLNERVIKSQTGDSEWTETTLLIDKFTFCPPFGPTPPEVYDTASQYDD